MTTDEDTGRSPPEGVTRAAFRLGALTIEPQLNRIVDEAGEPRHLEPASMDVLSHLASKAPDIVSANELLERFWADTVAEESTIHRRINAIRSALGDDARNPSYIETVPKRGYRVIAEVRPLEPPESDRSGAVPEAVIESVADREGAPPRIGPRLLGGLAMAAVLVAVIYQSGVVDRFSERDELAPGALVRSIPRLAVLPFDNLSSQPGNDYLAAGFHEDILTGLAGVGDLEVISRTSVERYGAASALHSVRSIADDLGVSHVLEGSLQREADTLRITVQLIDAENDSHLWAATFDRDVADLFAVQSEVARQIASHLSLELVGDTGRRLEFGPTPDLAAYDRILEARQLIEVGTTDSLRRAASLMDAARQLDPRLAQAHVGYARALFLQTFLGTSWADVRTPVLAAIERAFELDDRSAAVHLIRAHTSEVWEKDHETATRHYLQALELEPNNTEVLLHYGAFLGVGQGRTAEALPYVERAQALDPLNAEPRFYLASVLRDLGRMEDAWEVVSQGLRFESDDIDLRRLEVELLRSRGALFEAAERSCELIALDPQNVSSYMSAVYPLLFLGEVDAAQRWADRMQAVAPDSPITFTTQMWVYFVAGDGPGLAALVSRWQSMNTERRTEKIEGGQPSPFGVASQIVLLSVRAEAARARGEIDADLALSAAAVEVAGDLLRDGEGELRIGSENYVPAMILARDLLRIGRTSESHEILQAVLREADPTDFYVSERMIANALLGDVAGALVVGETNHDLHFMHSLEEIQANELGWFDDLVADPRWAVFYDTVVERNRALRQRLHRELPELINATVGL